MQEVVRHYGDPAAEYLAARDDAGIIERADRAFVRMHGRDPLRMLQGLVTNDVTAATDERAVYAALLTPKGRMLADVRVLRDDGALLVECDRGALDNVVTTLRRFVPPLFARFDDVTDEYGVIGVHGERSEDVVRRAAGDEAVPSSPHEDALAAFLPDPDVEPARSIRTRYAGEHGIDIVARRDVLPALGQRLIEAGARPFGHATLDVLRIEAGRPRWGAELTEQTIPLEADLLPRAISTSKGCYTGQEVIVRILHRGHVNWQLRGVLLGDVPAPPPDSAIVHPESGKRVGRITSACASPRHDQTIALAYVRRELEPPVEARLGEIDGGVVSIVALPFPVSDLGGALDVGTAG